MQLDLRAVFCARPSKCCVEMYRVVMKRLMDLSAFVRVIGCHLMPGVIQPTQSLESVASETESLVKRSIQPGLGV